MVRCNGDPVASCGRGEEVNVKGTGAKDWWKQRVGFLSGRKSQRTRFQV